MERETKRPKEEPITRYALVGYDKDNDNYEVIETNEDLEALKAKGEEIAKIQEKTGSIRRKSNNEPFDWFEIVNEDDADYPDYYYWASYEATGTVKDFFKTNDMTLEEKLEAAFGSELIGIIKKWPQLSPEDIKEIYEKDISKVYAVYNDWKELAMMQLKGGACEEYVIPFVNIEALAKYLSEVEKNDWIELPSGKLINCG